MLKKSAKIYIVILAIAILLIGIVTMIVSNKTEVMAASSYKVGDIVSWNELTTNTKLYCIDHGKDFVAGLYRCYSTGNASAAIAYAVLQQGDGRRDPYVDDVANVIWELSGSTTEPGANYSELLNDANAAAKVNWNGSNIGIDRIPAENPLIPENDSYGAFKITYPSYNGELVGDSLTVSVNGKTLSNIPESETEFSLTEADGIVYGKTNTITVSYSGTAYGGSCYYFTPKRTIFKKITCKKCKALFVYSSTGYVYPNSNGSGNVASGFGIWSLDDDTIPGTDNAHIGDCNETLKEKNAIYTYYDNKQDLIYIEPETKNADETVSLSFWAGKPKIQLELDKINPSGKAISGATFSVNVSGGAIGTIDGPTTGAIGSGTLDIIAGKNNNTVTVTLEEIDAPEDYIKIEGPIVIEYTFSGSSWSANLVSYPQGEKVELTSEGTVRDSSLCMDSFKLKVVDRPTIKIELDKKDTMKRTVPVSFSIKVSGGKLRDGGSISDGGIAVIEPDVGATSVTVELTENDPGEKYIKYKEPIVITFTSDANQSSWTMSGYSAPTDPEKVTVSQDGENKVLIEAINRRTIIVSIHKTDNSSAKNPLTGITFSARVTQGGKIKDGISSVTTDDSGYAKIIIEPDGEGDVILELTEEENTYYISEGSIEMKFVYRNGCWSEVNGSTKERVSISGTEFEFGIDIQNRAKIEDVRLLKLNKFFPDEAIEGITFEIQFSNAKTLSGASSITRQTDSNGQIDIGTLEISDPTQPVTISLRETGTPTGKTGLNYRGLEGATISITVTHRGSLNNMSVTNGKESLVSATYDNIANIVSITAYNEVTLDLSGRVWEDGQTGIKPVSSPNGLQDNTETENKGIAGIAVSVKAQGNTTSSGTNSGNRTDVTDANGKYSFTDLPASTQDRIQYYIEFTYDGINYIVTTQNAGDDTIDSDVSDINRTEFNNKFHTITKDTATGTNGQTTKLEYTYDATSATLTTKDSNGNVKTEFAMVATTRPTTYTKNTSNIDMGLVKRGVNLAAFTDIEKATVSINGKVKEYSYNDISQIEETDEYGNLKIDNLELENKQYNLFLYKSDYNYRISDYPLKVAKSDYLAVNQPEYKNELEPEKDAKTQLSKARENGELNVEVTYQVLLNNRSATNATINEFAYYYDQRYELIGVQSPDAGYNIVSNSGNKLVISGTKEFTDTDNQSVLELTFMLKKDNNGSVELGKMQNWVEITSYSTDEGCIDYNSAPDNMQEHNAEDDTDDAPGLVVQLNNSERQTSGYVFEDNKSSNEGEYNTGNGLFDSGENPIDDVIVQLIEVKNVTVGNTTLRLEYIWQETVSGSSTVRYMPVDGTAVDLNGNGTIDENEIPTYTVTNEPGQYTFNMNVIPGDYIVRFIYGDNTYWDTAKNTANLLKYNGQDYKSTIDIYYDKAWYVDTYYENSSMARDNEARRLEQITYARTTSETDATQLAIDSDTKLDNTWMCAETSAVWTDISKDDGSIKGETHGDSGDPIKKGINFGLVGRPRAKLVLEKHITRLYIEGLGESYTNLQNYEDAKSNGLVVNLESNQAEVVLPTATNKEQNQRGEWLVQTETSTIAGNELSITYSYTVKNIGDSDYIGETLRNKIAGGETYAGVASEAKNLSYMAGYIPGAYLGAAYYNGSVTTPGQSAASIPFQIEDYMSTTNGLKIDESGDFKAAGTDDRFIWSYDSSDTAKKDKTEHVNVIQTDNVLTLYANERTYIDNPLTLRVFDDALNSTSGSKELTYRSYAAQLIYPTTGAKTSTTGILSEGMGLQNLETVQSYVETDPTTGGVALSEFTPEPDEFVAETVIITLDTGADKQTPTMLIITITAGLAVVAVGIVVIKKFIIK